jgi:hypothetical protein
MKLFSMNPWRALRLFAQTGTRLAVAAVVLGCGDNYRPVITPVQGSGPPPQPPSYAVAVSAPSPTAPGIVTIIDYSGDSIETEAPIGPGPTVFTVDATGSSGYTINSDGTLSNFQISTTLQAKYVATSTLPPTAIPVNLTAPSSALWATDLDGNVVDYFSGSPEAFKLAIPLATPESPATMPVMVSGLSGSNGQREYVISQNVSDTEPTFCNNPSNFGSAPLGAATPIEVASSTTDPAIPVGRCPVAALETTDQQRLFVLNRGDDTITVINASINALDFCTPFQNQNGQTVHCHPTLPLSLDAVTATGITPPNGTAGMTATAGPVFAEYNAATEQLAVANYDGGTMSVIDVSLDQYGNDSATFGTTYTIPVGSGATAKPNPAAVTVLYDGSKAYTANQNDDSTPGGKGSGTVSVVNLSTHTVEKTLTVVGHPRTVVSTQNSEYSKVYVASPDSPFITIIQSTPTVTDLIDTTLLLEGNVVDVRVTTLNGGTSSNDYFWSRVPGYGQPCNLSDVQLKSQYGQNYLSTLTLGKCQEQVLP